MRKQSFPVVEWDVPPANHQTGQPTKCGWCNAHVGEEHDPECVCRLRTVVLSLTIEFVSTVPEWWSTETLEFVQNGNTSCATNHVERLMRDGGPCFCGGLRYVREATSDDEERLPWSHRWRE